LNISLLPDSLLFRSVERQGMPLLFILHVLDVMTISGRNRRASKKDTKGFSPPCPKQKLQKKRGTVSSLYSGFLKGYLRVFA
jgi:hypothetical protein